MAEKNGGIKIVRGCLLLLALIVFLGNIMMWILMPTEFYSTKMLPKLMAHTDSTYFGIQGLIMLDFTFPILFIAVIGCIYIHLGKKIGNDISKESGIRKRRLKSLKRPMIIKGLGIVNWIELFLLGMFVSLLVWYFSAYMHSFYQRVALLASTRGDKVWQVKMEELALALGLGGNLCLTFLYYPVTRGSSILPLLGLTSEASIKYHTWIGHMTMFFFTTHGFLYILYWFITNQASKMIEWESTLDQGYVSNLAGEISLLCGLALWITTYPTIRRKMFELFFYTHYLYIPFMIFFILHLGIFFPCIMLPGFYLFAIDRYLRFLQSRQNVRLVSARILPCETFELNFAKTPGLSYTPTSTIFINVPSISTLQWHPFTISSNSNLDEEIISVLIKVEGSWTNKLYKTLSSPTTIDRLEVSLEGPYGPATTNFLRHDTLVMVSGGSGIAPFISIIRELLYLKTKMKCKTPKIHLITAFKNSSHLSMLGLLTPISGLSSDGFSNLELQIEAYVTREKFQPTEKPEPIRTIMFKPLTSDAPLSPILGENNWIWLGLIISSSFIIFLILIGIVTQYYIYPIDHNMYRMELSSKRALLNMLFICFSIAITATGAFLWNKKWNSKEAKNIQEMKGSEIVDNELESFPRQSLTESTRVHYGRRPDIKSILLEAKGSSVGVLVSGPKKMRHDVATICSSRLGENLHFESISFSW